MARGPTLSRLGLASLAAIACCVAAPARADADGEAAFVVSLIDCDEIDRALLLSLLELELSDVADELRRTGPPLVELQCIGDRLHVQVRDTVTGKHVGRTVPRPRGEHGERSVALAVSQLFLTSWLELLLPSPILELPAPAAAARPAVERRARAAMREPHPPESHPPEPTRTFGLTLFGGVGVRDLAAPILTEAFALSGQIALDGEWAVLVGVGLDHGHASRERGAVELWLGNVGLGIDYALVREGDFTLGLGARGGVVWGRLAGHPGDDDVRGDAIESIGARLGLASRASLALGWLVLSLELQAGVDLGLPVGLVRDEQAVSPGGAFGRALVGVGVRFGG